MRRVPATVLILASALGGWSGCITAAKVFLDIPEGRQTSEQATQLPPELLEQLILRPQAPPPALIDGVTGEAGMLALLPSDHSGGVDYVAAVREGVIRPRPGPGDSDADTTGSFSYDLYLSSGDGPEAYFPHSTHREWLDCVSCHPRVYRNGKESMSPGTAHTGESCGYCHGPVAFPIQACERCHEAAGDLPAGRRPKILNSSLPMARMGNDEPGERASAFAGLDLAEAYPPASFPHDMHRLRFQCRACHERPFPMVQGATVLSQEDAHSGAGCGACHNGTTAFEIDVDACDRCHVRAGG